jgi:hypothetical protein
MKIDVGSKSGPGKAIYQLIVEAQAEVARDRRAEARLPFFRPVSIKMADGHLYSAFSREISAYGIGLIHNIELKPGAVELIIPSEEGHSIYVRARIVWCESCGEGWFVSGGQFEGIATAGN